ncbi:phosphate acyltransferase PlsX [bacterium]|nr:phosphate acyltransferase PlsX [bacterium]
MIIALDAMGGDFAPEEIVKGAILAQDELEAQIALVGSQERIAPILEQAHASDRLFIRHASEVVEMEDSPRVALRSKPDSSVAQTVNMVLKGEAQACVSAGNSGAYMALCHTRLRTIPGIDRPAIALFFPTAAGPRVILDAGANADCKPAYLQQFGIMGSVYAEFALGLERPRVGVLSIGTESHKGNELTQAAMPLLAEAPINFIGNVEGDQIFGDEVDVVVCDGFVGNVVLKVAEGLAGMLFSSIKKSIARSMKAKLGALLLKDAFGDFRRQFDYQAYGGALLLGVNGICVVSHGKSDAQAIKNALLVAERSARAQVVEHVRETCQGLMETSQSLSV